MIQLRKTEMIGATAATLLIFCGCSAPLPKTDFYGKTFQREEQQVKRTAEEFIEAFKNLNWERFCSFFAADATAFFPPSARFPQRADGRTQIENVFRRVFENARRQRAAPPYLDIEPRDLNIQLFDQVAIVTFHLEDPGSSGRRSLVLRKQDNRWMIVHLHASAIVTDNQRNEASKPNL